MRIPVALLICLGCAPSASWAQDAIPVTQLDELKSGTVLVKVVTKQGPASGSGFLVRADGPTGYIVTNEHVIRPRSAAPGQIEVVFWSGTPQKRSARAELVASDPDRDLAVLKVTGFEGLPKPLDLRQKPELVETTPVKILGFPGGEKLGKNITINTGTISSIRLNERGQPAVVQLDANINPGQSGGPVVDAGGRLIGVLCARVEGKGRIIQGIGLAVPAGELAKMLNGRLTHCALVPKKPKDRTAEVDVEIRLLDPLEKIKTVTLNYLQADAGARTPEANKEGIGKLAAAKKVDLPVDKQKAKGTFKVSGPAEGVVLFASQASYVDGEGKTILSDPLPFRVNFGAPKATRLSDELVSLKASAKNVRSHVAFAPDGATLASSDAQGNVIVWDVTTAKERTRWKAPKGSATTVTFSPDGKLLAAAGSDRMIRLWEAAGGQVVRQLEGHRRPVRCIVFAPDGHTLASSGEDLTVRLWDVATGKELATLKNGARCVAFAPDGKTLASDGGNDKVVRLWDAVAGKQLAQFRGHDGAVFALAFAPDGKTLASASNDKTVKLWNVVTGQERRTLLGHKDTVRSVAFTSDGETLASASEDRTVKLWDVASGKERITFTPSKETTGKLYSVAFSPDDGRVALGSGDGTVKLWDITKVPKVLDPKEDK
ncbi:MAG: trypsin-like peptidase domain-containing protein [Planctomycetes bacterium]|nr:trypsin-like peptidase domain-containing protein [Planctomycetota bacterium]